MKHLILIFMLGFSSLSQAQSLHLVRPSDTDTNIDTDDQNHWIYINQDVATQNKLFVFLPGSFAFPALYTRILKTAANLGYHAIGLNYPNPIPINTACALSPDTTCHGRAREEVFDGIDRHPVIDVSPANSIQNRLIKLLQHLDEAYPGENWQQYWEGDNTILWEQIILSGHSQGGGHAAFIGKLKSLERVAFFASSDWMPGQDRTPAWVSAPGLTSANRYFAFTHELDEALDFDRQQNFWQDLGMAASGELTLVDDSMPPFDSSTRLFTQLTPAADSQFHSSVVVDVATPKDDDGNPIFEPVWEYMISSPLATPTQDITNNELAVSISPNPAFDEVVISLAVEIDKPYQVDVYNLSGQKVSSFSLETNNTLLPTSSLPTGMYFLLISNEDHASVAKFVKA